MMNQSPPASRRVKRFAVAFVASLALGALAAGSASALSLTPSSGGYPVSLSLNAPWSVSFNISTAGSLPNCQSATGAGQLNSGTSGEIKITYKGCGSTSTPCTSPGQPAGTMVTSNLALTVVYLDAAKTRWGFKLDPIGTTTFAECSYPTSLTLQIKGSVLGSVLQSLGATTKNLNFHQGWAGWSEQEYQQIEGAGPKYHLDESWISNGQEVWTGPTAIWLENLITAGSSLTINP